MPATELSDRIQRARSVVDDPAVVDPYVRALASLADRGEAYLSALDAFRLRGSGNAELDALQAAEKDLRAVLAERVA